MAGKYKYTPLVLIWALGMFSEGLFSPACAGAAPAPGIKVESSQRKAPKWVSRAPAADAEYLYFVGRATASPTLEGAEQDAAADALRQIVSMIRLTASVSYERLRQEAGLLLEDRVSFEGDARVTGLKRLETYYQKVYYHNGDSLTTRYHVSLLVRYPRQSLAREKQRMEQEAVKRVRMAGELLTEGRRSESRNDGAEALERYLQALRHLDSPVIFLLPSGEDDRCVRLKSALLAAARSLSLRQRQVRVGPVVVSRINEECSWQDSQMNAALEEAMLNHGFRPVGGHGNLPGGVLPCVSARCREEFADRLGEGFCISRWSAQISLLDPDENIILFQKVLTAKGFGADPERALLDARRRLRQEVFPEFAQLAWDKLDLTLGWDSPSRMDYYHAAN